MSTIELLKPIIDGGIRSVNFFNGRVLSGEDLTIEKAANREERRLLGQAIGEGIAYGLEVSKAAGAGAAPVVTIKPGVAINRKGQSLRLASLTDLSLVQAVNGNGQAGGPLEFSDCQPFQNGVYVANPGIYLLTITPVEVGDGRAPVSGLQNTSASCNTKYLIDGVKFRLIQLNISSADLNDPAHLRNFVAYKCFGVEDATAFITNPFGPPKLEYGLLDSIRPNFLTDCDVPLAVLHWTTTGGINFVDMWSVRRSLIDPTPTGQWSQILGSRRVAEAEAMILQFHDQVETVRLGEVGIQSIIAKQRFRYLPPSGIIPIADVSAQAGFKYLDFFTGVTYRDPVIIEGARVPSLFREALNYTPIDLNSQEMIWLYWVRENIQAFNNSVSNRPQPYMIFTNGHMPFFGEARFDLAHWNYGNYV